VEMLGFLMREVLKCWDHNILLGTLLQEMKVFLMLPLTYQSFFFTCRIKSQTGSLLTMEQYIDWEWFQNHASYVIPAIIQIIFWEEIFKEARKFTAYILGHKRWLR
jgi:hypothetical protein